LQEKPIAITRALNGRERPPTTFQTFDRETINHFSYLELLEQAERIEAEVSTEDAHEVEPVGSFKKPLAYWALSPQNK
jgi:hypothetical protein